MFKKIQTWLEDSLFATANGPTRRPQLSADLESNIPGLFIVGDLAGAPVIKLAMEQGYNIIQHIASLPRPQTADGDTLEAGHEVCRLEGLARGILSGERTALNFLQTLSGTATRTRQYVDAVAGTGAIILDTRKTLPGMRVAQKYAVRCGGGSNHRMGLYDAVLIKENHIAAAGSISAALSEAKRLYPDLLLEVEAETLEQIEQSYRAGAQRVLLDNFSLELLNTAVDRYKGRISLEASGGITLQTVREIAETGVDFISTGEISKSVQSVDFSMRFVA